jgi:hypothetical protein
LTFYSSLEIDNSPGKKFRTHKKEYQYQDSGIPNTHRYWLFLDLLYMADERDPSNLYKLFGHVTHKLHFFKVDRIGRNGTGAKLTSQGKSLKMCRSWKQTDRIGLHLIDLWWLLKISIEK